jgi:hypothetical protein
MALSPGDAVRYGRQLVLDEVGARGQERLCAARVLVTGSGAAAEEARVYLRAAGVRIVADPEPGAVRLDVPGPSRLHGAWAALRTACAVSGAADTNGWPDASEVRWSR